MTKISVTYPLYVCLDDGEVMRIAAFDEILGYLEAIDIENDEYLFWDATGAGLKVLIEKGRVSGFESAYHPITLKRAFHEYAKQLGTAGEMSGTPDEMWERLQEIKASLPPRRSLLSKLFGNKI